MAKTADMSLLFETAMGLQATGRAIEAEPIYRQILRKHPDHVPSLSNLGCILTDLSRPEEAIPYHRRAATIAHDNWQVLNNLANALRESGDVDGALDTFQKALRYAPQHPDLLLNIATTLKDVGRVDESLEYYRQSLSIRPKFPPAWNNYLFALLYQSGLSDVQIKQEAQRWGSTFYPMVPAPPHGNSREPDRRLKVAYVGAGFWDHCQALFMLPVLQHHDRTQVEVHVYSTGLRKDAITHALHGLTDHWHDARAMDDAALAGCIRQAGIDILVDLTLHMTGSRLGAFANQPAPVQITWLGYPGTTGLPAMQYRLSDPHLDPETSDSNYTETTLRLPETFWCYQPLPTDPVEAPTPLPALKNGHITFGCLNNFCKVSDESLRLWGQVLQRLPTSRLILLCPSHQQQQHVLNQLSSFGVTSDRVSFRPFLQRPAYLRQYHEIDLCLDTLPYNGHTTSLDALWMGVAVLTRVGSTVVGRAGLSQLSNLNLPELVISSDEEFVTRATALATDLPRLAELRSSLRTCMEASPLMDGPRFARNLEDVYRRAWQHYCSQQG